MHYTHTLGGIVLGLNLLHIREYGMIPLGSMPNFIQHLEAAFGDRDRVATADQKVWEIMPKLCLFSWYEAEFHVIAANVDWNHSPL